MKDDKVPTVAVSLGDPSGIGPEVTFKALASEERRLLSEARFLLFGPLRATAAAREFGLPDPITTDAASFRLGDARLGIVPVATHSAESGLRLSPARARSGRIERRGPSREGGAVSYEAVVAAARACMGGYADALVTAPISKKSWAMAGKGQRGHTELLGEICGVERPVMMLEGGGLRVALATTHLAIADLPGALSREGILAILKVLHSGLRDLYGIRRPRIGVLALNPHAGEGGIIGREEISAIRPAIASALRAGMAADGPLPGDAAFHWMLRGRYDAILAMYHDQGLTPLKTLAFEEGVNITLGLPIIRTSPDHGTAFDIAGKGIADPRSMIAAARKALEFVRLRTVPGSRGVRGGQSSRHG